MGIMLFVYQMFVSIIVIGIGGLICLVAAHEYGRTFDEIVWLEKIKHRRGCDLIICFNDSKTKTKALCEGEVLHKRVFLRREMRCNVAYLIKGD